MLQTLEAVLQPNGPLQFQGGPAAAASAPRQVLVTSTDEPVRSDTALNGAALNAQVVDAIVELVRTGA